MVDMYSSHSKNPSFSSTLLDAIYRSFDQVDDENMVICRESRGGVLIQRKDETANLQRDCFMEKRVSEKVVVWEKSAAEANSISISWDSIPSGGDGGAGFCASLNDDTFCGKRLKPIRVWDSGPEKDKKSINRHEKPVKNSRALKMYAGLKKVKQPISPGAARIAGFLSSLFSVTGKYSKKPDINSPISKSADSSTCSSASSFSRSCLSKTPSCRGKPNGGGEKRSVKFSPVSVIVNQNNNQKLVAVKNSGKNRIFTGANIDEEMLVHAKEMNRKVEEAARDLLRNYQKRMDREFPIDLRKSQIKDRIFDEESEEDVDDAASYASSDLFELDNLSAIGMDKYREELPVYETTRLPANGFIL